uniref:Uncharacterized protein n=1 Tax=Arundo donax TaxID=35708 RepID=A0A0A9ETG0_ARUDO
MSCSFNWLFLIEVNPSKFVLGESLACSFAHCAVLCANWKVSS